MRLRNRAIQDENYEEVPVKPKRKKKKTWIIIGIVALALIAYGNAEEPSNTTPQRGPSPSGNTGSQQVERQTTPQNKDMPEQKEQKQPVKQSKTYESVYNEYAAQIKEAGPKLIDEYKKEAAANQAGLDGLADIANAKVEILADICTDGGLELAECFYASGSGKYEDYQSWYEKLYAVYDEEAQKIYSAYINSVM